ncbi:Hypothetical protein PACV_208 [Pacmanvirus A23]|uniref:Hypothetical protein n=1 Tax=Pacmanvirus A23 TaxID=1932881 RepID=UPI000A09628B|nr:Hypothetical protein B9W72_gp206 [Pacmanvirus A23]SIP85923.1 Hypothetical protein PACV_208 [Pacmanvirus A23]
MEINIEDSIELNKKLHSAAKDRADMEIICSDGSINIWSEIIINPPDDFKYTEYDENSRRVLILENNRVKIVKIVFDFMQFNELPAKFNLNFNEVCELLLLANKYNLTAIVKRCSNLLKKSKDNAPTTFTLVNLARENKINELLDFSMNKLQQQSKISIHAAEIYSLCDEKMLEIKNEAFKTIVGSCFSNYKVQYICNVCKIVQAMNEDCMAPRCKQRGPITHMYNNMCGNFHLIDAKRTYLCNQYNKDCRGVLIRTPQQLAIDKIPDSINAEIFKKGVEHIRRS